ncbi:TPA: aquaporin [bacterium UBP9_UBA11836]|nr:aquaporin [bacterium UBP9_UBA11836]
MKKYLAEFMGTAMLVFFGCGAAILHKVPTSSVGCGYLGVAIAFGLVLMAMVYSIGPVSGCHLNPAVSLAMVILGRMETKDFTGYLVAQVMGAFVGAFLLYAIIGSHEILGVAKGSFGCNGFGDASNTQISGTIAFLTEVVLTFCFVSTVLFVTSKPEYASVAGLVIGLCLVAVHIVGLPLTGTSVNPVRSLAPACVKGGQALAQVWVFIIAPLIGGALAAFYNMAVGNEEIVVAEEK